MKAISPHRYPGHNWKSEPLPLAYNALHVHVSVERHEQSSHFWSKQGTPIIELGLRNQPPILSDRPLAVYHYIKNLKNVQEFLNESRRVYMYLGLH